MVKNKILRASALVAASAGLMLNMTAGVAGASSSSGVIHLTGPDSLNKVISKSNEDVTIIRRNNVLTANATSQAAFTGDASQHGNTTGGSVSTGDAMNRNTTNTSVSLMSTTPTVGMASTGTGGGGVGQIDTTGPSSSNVVVQKDDRSFVDKQVNNVAALNFTEQTAVSGDASSSRNTTGGDVMSGAAYNSNSTMTTLTIGQ